jgi:hypothetical protein
VSLCTRIICALTRPPALALEHARLTVVDTAKNDLKTRPTQKTLRHLHAHAHAQVLDNSHTHTQTNTAAHAHIHTRTPHMAQENLGTQERTAFRH